MTDIDYDLQMEKERIELVLNEIDRKVVRLEDNVGGLKKDIVDFRKTFWDDVTVNVEELDDIIETQASIKQQAEVLSERERNYGQVHKQLKILSRLKDSPYFGRVDFLEEEEDVIEPVYLGIASLMDENDEHFLIYDWRAPISSLYYDFYPGPAEYDTPHGTIKGKMKLKRQFITRNGQIKGMFDTGVTIGDKLLQQVLSHEANPKMKSIVATIQKEQNQIIRNESSKYLIVQGVAGSGKTSAALQRVAYLLYRYRKTLNAENIMLFSPNTLFNSYVATVLPELGEENMVQTTYQGYLEGRLYNQFTIESPFAQMEYLLTAEKDSKYESRLAGIRYKSSQDFKVQMDHYLEILMENGIIFKKISFRNKTIITAEQIKIYFDDLGASLSISNRMKLVTEWLLKELTKIERAERKKDWVHEESELLDRDDYLAVFKKLQQRNADVTFDDFKQEQRLLAKMIVNKHFKPIKTAVKNFKYINVPAIYCQFFEMDLVRTKLSPAIWKEICAHTIQNIKRKKLSYEDATPYLYLQDKLEGQKPNTNIRHLFIDEAQDYSPFQFAYLKELFPNCKMTILGDMNQAIYAHSINAPTLVTSSELYEDDSLIERITLTRSYRSTRQIVEFTKGLIAGGEAIEPFNRDGVKPTLTEVENEDILHEKIIRCTKALTSAGYQTIAIICKSVKESNTAYNQLKNELPVRLIDKETDTFDKGILILSAYFAKGIEFDAVIIYDGSNLQYGNEFDRNLFYTACTRAMHELHIFSLGEKNRFINEVVADTYEMLD